MLNSKTIDDLGIVIVAGGSSSRFGQEDKLLIEISNMPIVACAVKAFLEIIPAENIVVVTASGREEEIKQLIKKHLNETVKTVCGGATRSNSSLNGLKVLSALPYAAVHDAARPYIRARTIRNCYESLKARGSAVLAHPVTDTIKVINEHQEVLKTPPRDSLCAAETPQMFPTQKIIAAYEQFAGNSKVTDEAMAMELAGHPVYLHLHEEDNRKITYSSDLN